MKKCQIITFIVLSFVASSSWGFSSRGLWARSNNQQRLELMKAYHNFYANYKVELASVQTQSINGNNDFINLLMNDAIADEVMNCIYAAWPSKKIGNKCDNPRRSNPNYSDGVCENGSYQCQPLFFTPGLCITPAKDQINFSFANCQKKFRESGKSLQEVIDYVVAAGKVDEIENLFDYADDTCTNGFQARYPMCRNLKKLVEDLRALMPKPTAGQASSDSGTGQETTDLRPPVTNQPVASTSPNINQSPSKKDNPDPRPTNQVDVDLSSTNRPKPKVTVTDQGPLTVGTVELPNVPLPNLGDLSQDDAGDSNSSDSSSGLNGVIPSDFDLGKLPGSTTGPDQDGSNANGSDANPGPRPKPKVTVTDQGPLTVGTVELPNVPLPNLGDLSRDDAGDSNSSDSSSGLNGVIPSDFDLGKLPGSTTGPDQDGSNANSSDQNGSDANPGPRPKPKVTVTDQGPLTVGTVELPNVPLPNLGDLSRDDTDSDPIEDAVDEVNNGLDNVSSAGDPPGQGHCPDLVADAPPVVEEEVPTYDYSPLDAIADIQAGNMTFLGIGNTKNFYINDDGVEEQPPYELDGCIFKTAKAYVIQRGCRKETSRNASKEVPVVDWQVISFTGEVTHFYLENSEKDPDGGPYPSSLERDDYDGTWRISHSKVDPVDQNLDFEKVVRLKSSYAKDAGGLRPACYIGGMAVIGNKFYNAQSSEQLSGCVGSDRSMHRPGWLTKAREFHTNPPQTWYDSINRFHESSLQARGIAVQSR